MSTNGVNFSTSNLPKQWQHVKRNLREMGILNQTEADNIEVKARLIVEAFFQRGIFAEFRQQLKADVYEHAEERTDVRSDTYPRIFTTTFGKTRLLIPKVRKKSKEYVYKLFAKYQRRQKKFDDMIMLSLLLGFSTRKQQRFFQAFIGDSVSNQTASRLLHGLSDDLRQYQSMPIEDKYRLKPNLDRSPHGYFDGGGIVFTRQSRFLEEGNILNRLLNIEIQDEFEEENEIEPSNYGKTRRDKEFSDMLKEYFGPDSRYI